MSNASLKCQRSRFAARLHATAAIGAFAIAMSGCERAATNASTHASQTGDRGSGPIVQPAPMQCVLWTEREIIGRPVISQQFIGCNLP